MESTTTGAAARRVRVAVRTWCYRLRRDFEMLLHEPGFTMVEMQPAPVPERPTNLRWALDWKIEIALSYRQ